MNINLSLLQDNWLIVALLAPALFALVNIIDAYFVDGVYEDEWDGLIISGLFHLAPWVFIIPLLRWDFSQIVFQGNLGINSALPFAFAGGFILISSYYLYFKALFLRNDVALFQIFLNLTVVVVPMLAFFVSGELLSAYKYAGIAVILFGATILSLSGKLKGAFSSKFFWTVMAVVLLLSSSLVLEERAYSALREQGYGNQGFLVGLFFFSLGAAFAGALFAFIKKRNPWILTKKYAGVFVFAEGLNFLGNLVSQRAIDIAPSVSYVATIGTFIPVFVMLVSFGILGYSFIWSRQKETAERIYTEQIKGFGIKIFATVIMAAGVYMIN